MKDKLCAWVLESCLFWADSEGVEKWRREKSQPLVSRQDVWIKVMAVVVWIQKQAIATKYWEKNLKPRGWFILLLMEE